MSPRKKAHFPEGMEKVLKAISDKKVENLAILHVTELAGYTDYFIIGTGNSSTHVQAMAETAAAALKVHGHRGHHLEGYQTASWVLMDGGDFVLHLFQPEARKFYALEDLWGDAKRIPYEEHPEK